MLGECGGGGGSDEVSSYKAVLHKACRELAIGGSRAHVILVAREQERSGREGEAVGRVQYAACEMEGSVCRRSIVFQVCMLLVFCTCVY
jgi:hypothetical protein